MRLEDAVVGIIAVESRREHIEKNTIPTLHKAGIKDVRVFYDPKYGQKKWTRKEILSNANANYEAAHRGTFTDDTKGKPIIMMTDDVIFSEHWEKELKRIVSETKGAKVYCLFTAVKRHLKKSVRGYSVNKDVSGYYDPCVLFLIDDPKRFITEFYDWAEKSNEPHPDMRLGKFIHDVKRWAIITTVPTLVTSPFKSEMGHGVFETPLFLDEAIKRGYEVVE